MEPNFSFRQFFSLILFVSSVNLFCFAASAQARRTLSFDNDWRFLKSNAANASQTDFDDSAWRKLNVPHDWSIEGPFDEKNLTGAGGGYLPSGVSWYRKHFDVSEKDKGRRFFIEFDGVMEKNDVWINGVHLGQRPNGYVSFEYELTEHLNFGKNNVIAVRADTTAQPASRWYTGAGIYRHVRLFSKDAVHIPQYGIFVTTPQIDEKQATVEVKTEVINQSPADREVRLAISIFDQAGKRVGFAETFPASLKTGKSADIVWKVNVKKPNRWHVDNPVMYKVGVAVISDGKSIDSEFVPFGMREFKFEAKTGFWLNGKNFKIKGVCIHHDGSAFGAAVPLAVWERRFNELRKLGANAIRTAHNPPAPEFLDLADRMGFLVMDEMFDQWTVAKNPADYELRTAGKPSKITLSVDRNTIANDWNEVAFVQAMVTDDNGVMLPNADDLISFQTSGAVVAVDSADINSHEPYQAATRKAFQGICLAMLKANKNSGKIKLTATAPNLKSDTIEIRIVSAKKSKD
jgi:beta-galactosidase